VSDYVRQGIAVPVSVLHQRRAAALETGETRTFCSLLYATGAKHAAEFTVAAIRPAAYRVKSRGGDAVAGFGPDRAGAWRCDADAWLVARETLRLVGGRSLGLGQGGFAFAPAANVSLDVRAGQMTVTTAGPTMVTAEGGASATGRQRLELPAGTHPLAVAGLDAVGLADVERESPQTDVQPPLAAPHGTAAQPLWSVRLAAAAPVLRITPADIDGDGQPELLVACGRAGHAVSGSGKLLWSHETAGLVRDVAVAHFTKHGPSTILVSSADTYLYQLDPAGRPIRKDQMTGIYFNVDHGERPWGVYCTRAVDTRGEGVDDLLVTTLASMECQGLTPDGKKLWRTLAAYHGCTEMAVADVSHDGQPAIVIADKYGSVHVLRPDGSRLLSSNTSIGDVTFALGDLNGDGRLEIVHGSSTGDLIAVDLRGRILWRFDNYGYPVERIRCVDLGGDGRPEVLIASGTGYVYCLDARGKPRWQRRVGLAVHDLVVAEGMIVAGTEDGVVHAFDKSGKLLWSRAVGAAVTKLSVISPGGHAIIVVGLADGRLLALSAK
jgi:hypothetical protein